MYTNNQLNEDGAAAKLFVYRLDCDVLRFLSLSSESVTEVRTNIYVTSFGPVSDTDMVSIIFLPPRCDQRGESSDLCWLLVYALLHLLLFKFD